MIKKYGLWYTIKYYFVIPYVIFALALAYADPHIVQFCSRLANVKTDELLYKVILYILDSRKHDDEFSSPITKSP